MKRAFFHKNTLAVVLAVALLPLTGCLDYKVGMEAYYSGDYPKAEKHLKRVAAQELKLEREFLLTLDANTTLEQALPRVTYKLFAGWEAYLGSLFAQNKLVEGCKLIPKALRPLKVTVVHGGEPQVLNPAEGSYWQAEVMAIRAWWANIGCPSLLR